MPLSRLSGSLTTSPSIQQNIYIMGRVGSTLCLLCHLSVKIAMTPTASRPRRQRLASDYDLMPLLCDSSNLLPSKMVTRHAGRNIRTDSSSPPLQRANEDSSSISWLARYVPRRTAWQTPKEGCKRNLAPEGSDSGARGNSIGLDAATSSQAP
jgi:hypothetical protein